MIRLVAPTWKAAIVRSMAILAAAALVFAATYAVNGAPSPRRRLVFDEIARFSPTLGHGLLQLLGELGLAMLFAWIARRGLKIRL